MPTPGSSCATPSDARLELPAEHDLILIWSSREGCHRSWTNTRFEARGSNGRSEVEIDVFGDLFDVPLEGIDEELARIQLTRGEAPAATGPRGESGPQPSGNSSAQMAPNAPAEVVASSAMAEAGSVAFGTR